MTWVGPKAEDLGTPLAWLFGTLVVLALLPGPAVDQAPDPIVIEPAAPLRFDGVTPASGSIDGGDTVVLRGSGLEGITVRFGDQTAFVISNNGERVTVRSPAHNEATVSISIERADGATAERQRAFTFVDYDAVTTSTASSTNSTTASNTTTPTSTATGTTTTTGTTEPPIDDGHGDVVWAFDAADARDETWYNYVALWPEQGPPPEGKISWQPSQRIDTWDFWGNGAPEALGDLTVSEETGAGLAFGGDNLGARMTAFIFGETGEVEGGIATAGGFDHLPWIDPTVADGDSGDDFVYSYVTYYFGEDQENPPEGTARLPWIIDLFRADLTSALAGYHEGEVVTLFVDESRYSALCGPFLVPCWGDLIITARIDEIIGTE